MGILDAAALGFVAYGAPIPIYAVGFQRFPRTFSTRGRLLAALLVLYALWWPVVAVSRAALLGARVAAVPVVGVTVAAGALAWLAWARRTIGSRALTTLPQLDPVRYPQPLIARGPYARVRHPRYVGYWLLALGLALATGLVALWASLAWLVVGFVWLAALEERELVRRFGAPYVAYQRDVPRFLISRPRPSPTARAPRPAATRRRGRAR